MTLVMSGQCSLGLDFPPTLGMIFLASSRVLAWCETYAVYFQHLFFCSPYILFKLVKELTRGSIGVVHKAAVRNWIA